MITALVGALVGGWMVFDGIHVMVVGKYFGPERPGPWSMGVERLGLNPFRLGPVFVVWGLAWLVAVAGVAGGQRWGWGAGVAVAVATLWYLPAGTVLSLVFLALLTFGRARWPGMP